MTTDRARHGVALLTGGTGFIGRRVAETLAKRGRRIALLCRPQSTHKLEPVLAMMPADTTRPRIVHGDLYLDGLGISESDRAWLADEVTEVFHLGAVYDMGMSETEALAVNLEGTRRVLDLAAGLPGLTRLHHVSTLAVSGTFQATLRAEDLDVGQGFDYAYGRSKFLAEKAVRDWRGGCSTTVYRPGVVVGDSRTGEMDKADGPYFLFQALHTLRGFPGISRAPMVVPRESDRFIHLVPVDYVVSALVELASRERSAGRTYHLLDPEPMSYGDFYTATLRQMGFSGTTIARPLERMVQLLRSGPVWPIAHAVGRAMGMPAEMLSHYNYRVTYDTSGTTRDLQGSGIACPRVLDYLPKLIAYFESNLAR